MALFSLSLAFGAIRSSIFCILRSLSLTGYRGLEMEITGLLALPKSSTPSAVATSPT